jgi:hypothetical protein
MYPKSSRHYHPLAEDDEEQHAPHLTARASKTPGGGFKFILLGVALTSAIVVTFTIIVSHQKHHLSWESCGSTPESARQRGCSFDLISFAWQTPECYDSSLVSEFATWDEWYYYTERRGNVTVPQSVVLLGEQAVWVSWHFHMVHCTFMWRQMHRAFERGWIDAHLRAYNHTLHCQTMLLKEGINDDDFNTNATVIYPVCERADGVVKGNWWDSVYSA